MEGWYGIVWYGGMVWFMRCCVRAYCFSFRPSVRPSFYSSTEQQYFFFYLYHSAPHTKRSSEVCTEVVPPNRKIDHISAPLCVLTNKAV